MIWKHIWSFILGLIIFYLQVLIIPALEIGGVVPLILIPWIVYIIWTREYNASLVIIFLIGLLYDTTIPETFGMYSFIFVIMGIALDLFRQPFESNSIIAQILSLLLANIIFHLISYLIWGISYGFTSTLISMIILAFFYNFAVSLVVYWIMYLISHLRIEVKHD
ncbi:MAG: rod shape-determining protein MreD [Candidatus Cloacimonadaceae bacterium]|jgi:rod shape-determining protein MreD|nr:rod shape-determining protein MreD [Candidatus Cloacimonadota bacterium]MCB5258258.1 rod shape-determining protein MreD [Candidatus Cloacimonadota bacterium]